MRTVTRLLTLLALLSAAAWGSTITTTGSGNWSSTTPDMPWPGGTVPLATDDAVIANGHTVTIDQPVSVASITVGQGVSGILTFDGVAARAVTVSGNVTVFAGATFITQSSGVFTNTMSIGGDLLNSGVFDMSQGGTTLVCNITFNKSGNQTVGGLGGTTRFNNITLNMGASYANILEINSTNFSAPSSGFITLTNGTLKMSGSYTFSSTFFTTAAYAIPATGGFWLNNANVTVVAQAGSSTNAGYFRITSGTFNVGTTNAHSLEASSPTTPSIWIFEGGTVNVASKLRCTSANLANMTISGSTINVSIVGNTSSTGQSFGNTNTTTGTFTMSGGTINLIQVNSNTTVANRRDYNVTLPLANCNITGGTLNVGTSATSTNFDFCVQGAAPNIVIDNTGNAKSIHTQTGGIDIYGDVTVNSGTTLNLYNYTTSVWGNATNVGNIYNSGTISCGTGKLVFRGSFGQQTYSATGGICTLTNLQINNSSGGMAISGGNVTVSTGTLTLTTGNLALGGNTLTLGTAVGTPGTLSYTAGYLTGTGTFTRWFGTSAITLPSVTGQFPMGVGTNNRNFWIGGTPATGGTVSVQYNDASSVSTVSISDNSATYVNQFGANWVVTAGNGFAGTTLGLQIQGSGIPGIAAVSDLNITGASGGAAGAFVTPTGSTIDPILQRSGIADQTALASTYYVSSLSGSALPVEMTSFTAVMQGANSALLRWSTATEVNNNGFEIERRAENSSTWTKVGYVAGAGTSNSPKEYTFRDVNLAPGVYVYRIKQTDNDGTFKYSASTQVDVGVAKGFELLSNYPNPFNPETNIRFSVPENGFATLKVFNMLGQEVATLFSGIAQAGHYIPAIFNAGKLASGVYFSRLDYNGKSLVHRMLLTK